MKQNSDNIKSNISTQKHKIMTDLILPICKKHLSKNSAMKCLYMNVKCTLE